jgi:hypothetical protein
MRRAALLSVLLLVGLRPAAGQEPPAPLAEASPAAQAEPSSPAQAESPPAPPAQPASPEGGWRTFEAERDVTPPPPAPEGPRIALVPFESVVRVAAAQPAVMTAVEALLRQRGFDLVPAGEVEAFLHARRIRYLDSLTPAQGAELASQTSAQGVLCGTILSWSGGNDPTVALVVRLLGPGGELRFSDLGALAASGTEGAFGRGQLKTPEALAARLLARLLEPVRPAGLEALRSPRPVRGGAPRAYRSRDLPAAPLRIAVLPLENLTEERDAPRQVDAAVQQRLAERPGLAPVGPAELRAALVKARLRPPAQLSPEQLRQLGQALGTPLVLRGALLEYGAAVEAGGGIPAVELHLILVDVESGRVLWSGLHRRTGLDYEGLLQLGAERSVVALAGRVVGELLEAFTRP